MLFSVVVPLYNKSYSISRCIDSILSQSYTHFELIIINDGSTDNSLAIVNNKYDEEIKSKIIKVIDQPNQGVSVARNKGVSVAKSDYICFLDADDEWLPSFLEKMQSLVNDYPNADLYALAHMVKKDGSKLTKPKHGLSDDHRGYVDDFFESSIIGNVANSSKVCIKRQPLEAFGGFPEGLVAGEDLYVWIRLALNGKVACDMSYSIIVHQEFDDSRSSRKNSVPYPLIFFSENKFVLRTKALDKYLFVIFYKHFLSSLLSFNTQEAFIRLKAYKAIYI